MTATTILWRKPRVRLILLAALVLAIAPTYVHPYSIRQGGVSEVPTILAGDTIIVNHAAYRLRLPYSHVHLLRVGSPRRDDMVLVTLPVGSGIAPKRVIAVPGDTFELRNNRVMVNGHAVSTKVLNRSEFAWVPEADRLGSLVEDEEGHWISYTPGQGDHRNHPPTRLAEDQFFLLGDNRDESADSRIWGPVPGHRILGKVILILPTGPRR